MIETRLNLNLRYRAMPNGHKRRDDIGSPTKIRAMHTCEMAARPEKHRNRCLVSRNWSQEQCQFRSYKPSNADIWQ